MALTIRPLDPEADLDAYLAVGSQAIPVPMTAAAWWERERRSPPGRPNRHLVGETGGRVVAIARVGATPMARSAIRVQVVVDRDERGRGHGRAMVTAVEGLLADSPETPVVAAVDDDDATSRSWAERRGLRVFDHTFTSRLDLDRFDPAPHRWAIERAAAAGVAIEPCDDPERVYELARALHQDVPAGEPDPLDRDEFQRHVVERPGAFTLVARAGDVLAGMATIVPMADESALNWLTGVRRDHRGRGLARALKVRSAEEARGRGHRSLVTQNHAVNAPMLAVNDALGYRRDAGLIWLRGSLRQTP